MFAERIWRELGRSLVRYAFEPLDQGYGTTREQPNRSRRSGLLGKLRAPSLEELRSHLQLRQPPVEQLQDGRTERYPPSPSSPRFSTQKYRE
ncbi:MAG: hypothetical protein BJ554DRAFT_7232 [Olpidium bornovanus]|uniref:Uncharacterized protein n=1 Tax=Olpidium bornovanus TaxID=278681 RepID=A0A8H7ZWS9_9FUNG|nr:MAG: hypothetical protein BJ554DRAFT_7232 [Olpidium bornovanus]